MYINAGGPYVTIQETFVTHTQSERAKASSYFFLEKIDEGIVYLPKIFSCLSITVLYNSVSLNTTSHPGRKRSSQLTFSPCQLPLHTSPIPAFPVESSAEVTPGRRTGQVTIYTVPATLNPSLEKCH